MGDGDVETIDCSVKTRGRGRCCRGDVEATHAARWSGPATGRSTGGVARSRGVRVATRRGSSGGEEEAAGPVARVGGVAGVRWEGGRERYQVRVYEILTLVVGWKCIM